MGKRMLSLYVDDESIELAKEKRINMSALFRSMLEVECGLVKGDNEAKLKVANAKLITALAQANKSIKSVEKKLSDAEAKIKAKQMVDEGWQTKK